MNPNGQATIPASVADRLPPVLRPSLLGRFAPAQPSTVVLTANTAIQIAPASPGRIGFFVLRSPTATGYLSISPTSTPDQFGVRMDGPGGFASIMSDTWFTLSQYTWYGLSQNGETVIVYEFLSLWG